MMFLRLNGTSSGGGSYPVMVNVEDISSIKPTTGGKNAKTVISLRSCTEFSVWVEEAFAEVEAALLHLGVNMAPHGKAGRNG